MRLELLPLIVGALVALVGIGLVADALLPDDTFVAVERRRRARAERSPRGELLVGLGVLLMAAALLGRDVWAYGNVAVFAGTALILVGAVMNRRYLRELFAFRGPLRRSEGGAPPTADRSDRRRIR